MSFSPAIIHLTEKFDKKNFPKHFSNQIYYSCVNRFEPYAYRSNFSIKLTLDGTESYNINRKHWHLRKGELLIVNNGTFVECFGEKSTTLRCGLSFFIEPGLIAESYADAINLRCNEVPEYCLRTFPSIEFPERLVHDNTLINYLNCFTRPEVHAQKLESAHYVDIAHALVDFKLRFENKLLMTRKIKRSTQLEIVARVEKAQQYLQDTLLIDFDLDALAKAACISKYLLIRCFRQVMGVTPLQFHQRLRMEWARNLLRKGYSVTATSAFMGYSNVFYFSRQFKRVTGMSPVQWRTHEPESDLTQSE